MLDRDYKIGMTDPRRASDPGIGLWNSRPKLAFFSDIQVRLEIALQLGAGNLFPGTNASRHMLHYLGNSDLPLQVDVENLLQSSIGARTKMGKEVRSAQASIKRLLTGRHCVVANRRRRGIVRSSDSRDWYFALGMYAVWGKGIVNIDRYRGELRYRFEFLYRIYDRDNWDEGKKTNFLGIELSDRLIGEFHLEGLAREFDCVGEVRRQLAWIGEPTASSDEAIIGLRYWL